MKINREEHPSARIEYSDEDGKVHIFDSMGDPWCETEGLTRSGTRPNTDENPGDWEWCEDGCLESGQEEGLLVPE